MKVQPTIGFEVHAQLKTESKLFCNCSTAFAALPNSLTCPVCLGFPGSLPVMNQKAVEMAVLIALALNCEIASESVQARKNYFYPDLPKGYQISQYKIPLAERGMAYYWFQNSLRNVPIRRVQLEEDTAKMFHQDSQTLLDFNRSGIPLVEIVTTPDFTSPEEGVAFLKELRNMLRTLGVCDGNMEEGSLRCEPNISVKVEKNGEILQGRKVELKNLGSFRAVESAILYEIQRQSQILLSGGVVPQETRGFHDRTGETFLMRTKEEEEDYRYFPDPDLPPLRITPELIENLHLRIPELPYQKRERFINQLGLSSYDAEVLTSDTLLSQFYEETLRYYPKAKSVANWLTGDVLGLANLRGGLEVLSLSPASLAQLIQQVESGAITGKTGKEILQRMATEGGMPEEWVKKLDVGKITDSEEITRIVQQALREGTGILQSYLKGKETAFTALMGLVMKISRGKADPQMAQRILQEKLRELKEGTS